MDTLLLPVMDALRVCICTELDDNDASTCFCGLYPGPQVAADFCACDGRGGCGMAWVRVVRIFPAVNFPQQDNSINNCATRLAAQLEIGAYRCLPLPSTSGTVDAVKLTQAVAQQTSDALALQRGIVCCVQQFRHRDFLLGTYNPAGAGDCGGGTWSLTVELRRDS